MYSMRFVFGMLRALFDLSLAVVAVCLFLVSGKLDED
jgi:hypothetical protein